MKELENEKLAPSDVESERSAHTMTEHHQHLLNNETINEPVKNHIKKRICLVGSVAEQQNAIDAAKTFNIPVLTSETGFELIQDDAWNTYFILADFEGPIFNKITKAEVKHKILGPPALIAASTTGEGLPSHNRPIYNYSMRGVVTVFTGIKKRDELTQLVHLIHYMGGSIRKEMSTKATHLICTNAYGDKYSYAQTFKLKAVRSSWVMDAWRNRDESGFTAQNENFTDLHLLKIFEGCRVSFIGFSESDKKYMVEQLRSHNGIETANDDETCTHKIISDNPVFANEPNNMTLENSVAFNDEDVAENEDSDDKYDYACQIIKRKHESLLRHLEQSERGENDLPVLVEEDENAKSGHLEITGLHKSSDGAILSREDDAFSITQNISPILKDDKGEDYDAFPNESIYEEGFREATKRKRPEDDSLDSISFMSVESTKKPKLSRAGSLTKNLRRRMSMTIVNPINSFFRPRRSTVDADTSSYSNFETTFNESIKEPIKEKFRQIKDKVCKPSKKDLTTPKSKKTRMQMASANMSILQDVTIKTPEKGTFDFTQVEFKTPKAPLPSASGASSSKVLRNRFKIEDASASFIDNVDNAKMVVEETSMRIESGPEEPKYYVVKAEWFWTRICDKYAPEADFLYKDYMQSVKDEQAEHHERRDSFVHYSASKTRKARKRVIVLDGTPVSAGKRRSSISDAGILSESLIDYTASPDKSESGKLGDDITSSSKKFSMRRNHFMDFYHTESNYVGILETIVKLFKVPLEKLAEENPDQPELLNKSEVKAIFSNFLPIYQVHKKMLNSLQEINGTWKEDSAIGQIIIENRDSLLKAYPPYINFFEQMKVSLTQCAQSKPRFQAFLKINQAKPECGRQSLQELMIRPVQRLPSISLLLDDIKKHTPKTNRDHDLLSEALKTIKEVMTYINEDKRKTEGQTQMFNIYYEIENCPSELLSSHRNFVSRCEVSELSETLSRRGDTLWLFLFNDILEICKKRSRFNHSKSPPYNNSSKAGPSGVKAYKHVKLIPLSSIRTLVDISDSPRAFALLLRNSSNIQDQRKDVLCSLSILDEEVDKTIFIKSFCKQLADNACRADAEKFVISVQSEEIGIDLRATNLGTLGKAFKFATRTGSRVTRAFSFNKTPSRKRNIASPFGSNASLTPSTISSMSNMKLHQASCMTLNEYDLDQKPQEQFQVIPLTDQMSRRNKKAAGPEGI